VHALGGVLHRAAEKLINWPTGIFRGGGNCGTKPIRPSTSVRSNRGLWPWISTFAVVGVLAQQAADQRGFSGPVGANQGDALAQSDFQVDAVENARASERFCDLLN
jgi:hypothetical protein